MTRHLEARGRFTLACIAAMLVILAIVMLTGCQAPLR